MRPAYLVPLLFTLCVSSFAQQTPEPASSPVGDNDVVRISTKLVQFDVLVIDKDGKQVRDLTSDDFQILQDGKPQKITNFSYVKTDTAQAAAAPKQSTTALPVRASTIAARRILTFIVDDGNCSASNFGMRASREGIEKFVREQMQPNDLVAIYQTRSGSSMLQQYTSDKAQLLKAAGKINWRPAMGTCSSSLDGSFFEAANSNTFGTSGRTIESGADRRAREHIQDKAINDQVVGSLGVLRYVIKGLGHVPGRKVVFFMSDGMPFRSRDGELLSAADVLRDLTELANRSSVVFNTIDDRGLFNEYAIEARDAVYASEGTDSVTSGRTQSVNDSRDGLAFLAHETGGTFYLNQNYLDVPIAKALGIENGYYLIGYDPADEVFKDKKFNKIEIKLNRPGLKVVSRSGFIGSVDESASVKHKSEDSDLYQAIAEPLPRPGLDMQLTAYYVNSPDGGDLVRALVHLEGNAIKFTDEGGLKKAVFEVVAVTLDEKNRVVDEFTKTHTFKVDAKAVPFIAANGLIYSTDVTVKKPGTYNFRLAMRDETSKQIGSSSQVVRIPDLKKTSLVVAGMTIAQIDTAGKFEIPAAAKPDSPFALTATGAAPSIRRFKTGALLAYAFTIYNPKVDPATGQPKLTVQTKLYRNGEAVIDGKPQTDQLEKQSDWSRINDFAYLKLTPRITPGDYSLQVIVTDLLGNGKSAVSTQSVDFTVIE